MSHWVNNFGIDEILENEGFVYQITNCLTGMKYIGKKFIYSKTTKKIPGKTRRKHIKKESDWRTYTSSSVDVKNDIKQYGKENFKFEILSLHKTRSETNYEESRLLFLYDVLNAKYDNGLYIFYNKNILLRYYRNDK